MLEMTASMQVLTEQIDERMEGIVNKQQKTKPKNS